MKQNQEKIFVSLDSYNTLGQNGTIKTNLKQIIVSGNGSDINNTKALRGRAKSKTITQVTVLNLMDVAKQKGDDEKLNNYWNTYYYQNRVIVNDGKLYGKYCKSRFCTLCSSVSQKIKTLQSDDYKVFFLRRKRDSLRCSQKG